MRGFQIAPLVLIVALLAFAWAVNVAWVLILCALLAMCERCGEKETLEGRVMLVTGGSSGIGKAIARAGVEG